MWKIDLFFFSAGVVSSAIASYFWGHAVVNEYKAAAKLVGVTLQRVDGYVQAVKGDVKKVFP